MMDIEPTGIHVHFPDAPAQQGPLASMAELRSRRIKHHREHYGWSWWLLGACMVLGAITIVIGLTVYGVIAVLVAVIASVAVLVTQLSRAAEEFYAAWGEARGLQVDETDRRSLGVELPLLRRGDEREIDRTMSGRIGAGSATMAHYTYTEISRDSEGHESRSNYNFTLVLGGLSSEVAARYPGVYCRRKSLSLGKLQDAMSSDRAVQTESAEFHKRYALRVEDSQSDVALFELFHPAFLHAIAVAPEIDGDPVQWEQRGAHLMVFVKGHLSNADDLDALGSAYAMIQRRYLEEYQ